MHAARQTEHSSHSPAKQDAKFEIHKQHQHSLGWLPGTKQRAGYICNANWKGEVGRGRGKACILNWAYIAPNGANEGDSPFNPPVNLSWPSELLDGDWSAQDLAGSGCNHHPLHGLEVCGQMFRAKLAGTHYNSKPCLVHTRPTFSIAEHLQLCQTHKPQWKHYLYEMTAYNHAQWHNPFFPGRMDGTYIFLWPTGRKT